MTVKKALFRCVKSNKVLYCETDEQTYLVYGSGYTDLTGEQAVDLIRTEEFRYQEGYFDKFVNTHSRTMKREV
jgi:hypothetical protein